MKIPQPEITPRTENFWNESFDHDERFKDKIGEIFVKTIEYFKKELDEEKENGNDRSGNIEK